MASSLEAAVVADEQVWRSYVGRCTVLVGSTFGCVRCAKGVLLRVRSSHFPVTRMSTRTTSDTSDAAAPHVRRPKPRILCLHGYQGSATALRSQMAPLLPALEAVAELVFIDAPSLAARDYGWWHAVNAAHAPPSDDPGVSGPRRHYEGWSRTQDAIVAAFDGLGPFDGILGFSQGAALAGLLVGLRAHGGPLHFDFAILVSGFSSNDPELAGLYARPDAYALPSLHVIGRADGIVPSELSRTLAARFVDPEIVEHDGGHVIPSDPRVSDRVRTFVEVGGVR
jgi:predicted esterase